MPRRAEKEEVRPGTLRHLTSWIADLRKEVKYLESRLGLSHSDTSKPRKDQHATKEET